MPDDNERRGLRYEDIVDPEFQKKWIESRKLDGEQVEKAFRHGFDSRGRFADRPFDEVDGYLRESWEGMGPPAPWDQVADIVKSGYEHYKGATLDQAADLTPEAEEHFPDRTTGGSVMGGVMGEQNELGAAERTTED